MRQGERFDTTEIDMNHPRSGASRRKKRKETKERRVPRWVFRVIFILFLSVAGVLLWFNRNNLTPANLLEWVQTQAVGLGIGDGYPYSIAGSTVSSGNFRSVNHEIFMLRDTELTVLNSTAKELISRPHSFSKPVLKVGGLRSLIYNLGGKGYQIESQSGTLAKGNAENNILAGAIAQNGRYALITQADGYFGCLTAYSAKKEVLFHYWFSDYYPTAAALNADGTGAVVTAVSAKNGGLTSAVYLIDFGSTKAVEPIAVYSENMLTDVSWADNGTAVVVGDRMASVIQTSTRKKTDYDYQGLLLSAYDMDAGRAALALTPYRGAAQTTLAVLDSSGKTTSVQLKQAVSSVSLYGDCAAALSGSQVLFYSASTGTRLGACDAGSDAKAIALGGEQSVYILGVSEVRSASAK
ncbi:MAG: hypothetical protein GX424_00470 [Clostridiales bacterium]|nr:hypothetical protein [Clostridiales bacterium]